MRSAPDGGLRVLLLCGDLRPGLDGVADYVVRLTEELRTAGAHVRILHTGPTSGVLGARTVGPWWTIAAQLRARRAARCADVVHVQFAPSMYRFDGRIGLLPLLLGVRPVVTLHEYGWWRWERRVPAGLWSRLERARLADRETGLLVPHAAAAIVTNPAHGEVVRARFGGGVAGAEVPIGANVGVAVEVDRATARSEVRRELGLDQDAVVIAFFGFVHPVKGVRYLGEAVAALAAEGRAVHLLVVGGFESLALPRDEADAFELELRGLLDGSGAGARTTVTGFLPPPAVSRLLAASDVACLPFTAGVTGKSGSLLTVLGHGLPTVVTAPPDEPDPQLADGDRVVLVSPVRDGTAIAAGLRRVLDDQGLARGLARRGAAWAAGRDWPAIAQRHLDLYAGRR